MDKQPWIDRMREMENLTDELEDPDAKWLLNWGIDQLDSLLQPAASEKAADEKFGLLMDILRKINRMAGARHQRSFKALSVDFRALADLSGKAFGNGPGATPIKCARAAARLQQSDSRQALALLTEWCMLPTSQSN